MFQDVSGFASKYPVLFRQLNYLRYIGKLAWPLEIGVGGIETLMADPGQHLRTGFGAVGMIVGGGVGGFLGGGGGFFEGGIGAIPGAIGGAAFGSALGEEGMERLYDKLANDSENQNSRNNGM